MAGSVEQFAGEVQRRAAGTPYVVTPTPQGFDVSTDLTDAQFWGELDRIGFRKAFIHQVACDRTAGTFVITDEEREVEWTAGPAGRRIPRLAAAARRTHGRAIGMQREFVVGGGNDGPAVVHRFSSEQGRGMIREAAAQTGWTSGGLPLSAKIGLFAAVGAVAVVVVIVVVLIVVL